MTKENNSLPIVPTLFHFIGLVAMVIFVFIGLNYVLRGNLILTGFLSLLAFVIPLLAVQYARVLKMRKLQNQNKTLELVLMSIFGVTALSVFPFIFHFVYIDFISKDDIKLAGKEKLEQLNEIQSQYDRALQDSIGYFENTARTKMNTYFLSSKSAKGDIKTWFDEQFGEGAIDFYSSETQVKNDVDEGLELHAEQFLLKYDLGRVREEAKAYYREVEPVFDNWKFLKISYYYYDIDRMVQKLTDAVVSKMPDWSMEPAKEKSIQLGEFMSSLKRARMSVWLLNTAVFLVLVFCVSMPYMTAKRPVNPLREMNSKNYKGGIRI